MLTKYTDSKDLIQIYLESANLPVDLSILDLNMKQAIDIARSREVKFTLKKAKQSSDRSMDEIQYFTAKQNLNRSQKIQNRQSPTLRTGKGPPRVISAKRDKTKQIIQKMAK